MIKILFYIDTLNGGGAEKVLRTLVNHMDQSQFDITVQTLFKEDYQRFLNKGIRYKYLFSQNNAFYRILYRIETALGLTYLLQMKDNYDVECAYLECAPTKILASSTNRNAKKVAWVHCDFSVAKDANFVKKTRKWYAKYDGIVCVSETVKKSFVGMFGRSDDTAVIHNAIDSNEIKEKSIINEGIYREPDKTLILSVGRLTPQKNYMRLLRTVKRLCVEGYNIKTWIIGEGEERIKLEKYIKDNHMEDSVSLLGFKDNPYPYMNVADVLVCSSDFEGFSTFITEGVILGKPIITTRCSGMVEILGESEYGIVTQNNDEDFYIQIKKLLESGRSGLNSLSEKSKNRSAEFSLEKLVLANEEYFKLLVR